MAPYEIEDTSDWLGTPSRLETVKHYAEHARGRHPWSEMPAAVGQENIADLVNMNDKLSDELKKARTWMANLEAETTEQLAEIQSLSLVRDQNESRDSWPNGRKRSINLWSPPFLQY